MASQPNLQQSNGRQLQSAKVMCDLFCGRGGWTKGFLAHGWRCIGIDLYPQPEYPGEFIQADIAQLYELPEADFYCCSSPCEQFSVHGMKHFHPNPKWPWLGIALFEHARQLIEATGKPYVMENVRAAQWFVGKAAFRCEAFFFWGNGIPCLMPQGFGKKMMRGNGTAWKQFKDLPLMERRQKRMEHQHKYPLNKKQAAQQIAEIPFPLASHIAQTAGAL